MDITAQYNENGGISATIHGVEMTVPDAMENRHRVMIAEWESDGNTILPYVPITGTTLEELRRLAVEAVLDAETTPEAIAYRAARDA